MLKVMTIVGTRPELIRLSRVVARLDATLDHVLVHTGQNYDYTLNEVFFKDLQIRPPDHSLGVDTSSLGRVLGETLIRTEEVLLAERPDAVLILGDTNSCLAGIMAKRMRIPLYHMEAGNRCFDENVPEETNRRLIDHVADFNLVYTEHARRNLLAEGIHPSRIIHTGSPMREVLSWASSAIDSSDVLQRLGLRPGGFFLASLHREENVDNRNRLEAALDSLSHLAEVYRLPIIVSTHPRTRRRLEDRPGSRDSELVLHRPFGFNDYVKLQRTAKLVLSDSGTISEEASILGFPAVTMRDSIERPEALESGSIVTVGVEPTAVLEGVRWLMDHGGSDGSVEAPVDYAVPDTSRRVLSFILSTARLHRHRAGMVSRP